MFQAKCSGVALLALAASLGAQTDKAAEPNVTDAAPAQASDPTAAKAAVSAKAPASARTVLYAQIQVDAASLRCFPTEQSPAYGETLAKGMFVRVLEAQGDYRQVELPLGPAGYVSKRFVGEIKDGFVTNESNKLSFRFEPKSGVAPVDFADRGEKFYVVDVTDDGKWYRARYATAPIWVASTDMQVITGGAQNETVTKAWSELEKQHRKQGTQFLAGIAAAEAAAVARGVRTKAFAAIEATFRTELQQPMDKRVFAEIEAATAAHLTTVPETDAEEHAQVTEFLESIKYNIMLVEAKLLTKARPERVEVEKIVQPKVESPLQRFDVIGRLRKRGYEDYVIEKGGQAQCAVTCPSGRYDLALFVGCEVGMVGAKQHRTHVTSMRSVDVTQIEIIDATRR